MGMLSTRGRWRRGALIAALCAVLPFASGGAIVTAQQTASAQRFVLRASPTDLPTIIAEHGLTVIEALGQHNLYLVERPADVSGSSNLSDDNLSGDSHI